MFTGFRERVLARVRKARAIRRRENIIIAIVAVVAVAIVLTFVTTAFKSVMPHPIHKSQPWSQEDPLDMLPYWQSGVHLNATGQIDKVYSYKEVQKLSKIEPTSDNVVLFPMDDFGPDNFSVEAVSNVTVDGVSYSVNIPVNANLDSPDAPKDAYNALVAQDPTLSLQGKQQSMTAPSLVRYVNTLIAQRLEDALKSGQLAGPGLAYNGTGTDYRNDDIAKAYAAGVNPNGLMSQCYQDQNQNVNTCVPSQLKYDFSCKTIGATFTDWSAFTDRAIKFIGIPSLRLSVQPGYTYTVNTTVPCRIAQSYGNPLPPQQHTAPPAPGMNP